MRAGEHRGGQGLPVAGSGARLLWLLGASDYAPGEYPRGSQEEPDTVAVQ